MQDELQEEEHIEKVEEKPADDINSGIANFYELLKNV